MRMASPPLHIHVDPHASHRPVEVRERTINVLVDQQTGQRIVFSLPVTAAAA